VDGTLIRALFITYKTRLFRPILLQPDDQSGGLGAADGSSAASAAQSEHELRNLG